MKNPTILNERKKRWRKKEKDGRDEAEGKREGVRW